MRRWSQSGRDMVAGFQGDGAEAMRRWSQSGRDMVAGFQGDGAEDKPSDENRCFQRGMAVDKLLNRPPPDIDKKEETLPHSTRRKLSKLRTNKSPLLMTYLHKIDPANHPAANCPLFNDPNHDWLHLFNCPDIPTTLTVWDLWTDPVGVAALLDVWGEKLGGPRAGV